MKTTTEISRTRLFLLAFWALITILSVTGAIAIYNQFGAWSEDDIAFLQSFIRGYIFGAGVMLILRYFRGD